MIVRLGFAVTAALRPDLLITDEILAVGDESFQRKCIRWIDDYLSDGGTLLLVSHGIYHVQKLCSHALWLSGG
ncbi:MAG: ABC transporter ATP-binding protein, partial [Lysobacteraceae bacterium]